MFKDLAAAKYYEVVVGTLKGVDFFHAQRNPRVLEDRIVTLVDEIERFDESTASWPALRRLSARVVDIDRDLTSLHQAVEAGRRFFENGNLSLLELFGRSNAEKAALREVNVTTLAATQAAA